MRRFFLDPQKPLATCSSETCANCPFIGRLQCHFGFHGLLRFFGLAFPPFILGGIGIAQVNPWLLAPWIAWSIIYFGFLEIRVMCSHCPHYAEPESKSLQCWANYGSPKLWKYRPGPMSRNEKWLFFAGLILIAGYPLIFLVVGNQWLLLAVFMVTLAGAATLMGRLMCAHYVTFRLKSTTFPQPALG